MASMLLLTPCYWLRRRLTASLLLLFSPLISALACSASSETAADDDSASGGMGGSPEENFEATIEFDSPSPVNLAPGAVETLEVIVTPPRNQMVTFEILTGSSEFDGFLLRSMSRVDENGRASTEIQAPTRPFTFDLRASIDDESEARLAIAVRDQGSATLNVSPVYTGNRNIDQWTASIHEAKTCEELESFFDDGSVAAQDEEAVVLRAVPSGTAVAVTLRGDELVSGCHAVVELTANTEHDLVIEVADRPLQIAVGTLELSLSVGSTTTAFAAHLENAVQTGLAAFRGDQRSDAALLLSRMQAQLNNEAEANFVEAGNSLEFESALSELWTTESPLSSKLDALLTGSAAAVSSEDVFVGELQLQGENSAFYLTSAAGVPIAVSGFFVGSTWSLSIESGDTFVLGGSLSYEPLRWLVAIAEASSSPSPAQQLSEAAQCSDVAELLSALTEDGPSLGCDSACLSTSCVQALTNAWEQQSTAGNDLLTTLQVGITGTAYAGGAAEIQTMEGAWVGRLEGEESSIGGPMRGERDAIEQ